MPSIANQFADDFIRHQVDLLRLEAGERRKIRTSLAGLRDELVAKLTRYDELTPFQSRRMEAIFRAAEVTIRQSYTRIAKTHRASMQNLAGYESERTVDLMNRRIGVSLLTAGVSQETLEALVDDAIVMGAPAKEWWAKQAPVLQAEFRDAIRRGVFAGESMNDLARRIRGTRERNFQDGMMARRGREAERLIRTSILSVANAARHETLKANDDVLAGQQWLSTLDPRTCEICMALSGQAWDFDGKMLGETTQKFPGPPPAHFSCRCTLVPLLKSWEQLIRDARGNEKLGRKLDRIERKLPTSMQASMDGQVADDLDYEAWLEERKPREQQEILGPGKYALWKKGKIGLTDLIDQRHRPLTLEKLREAS